MPAGQTPGLGVGLQPPPPPPREDQAGSYPHYSGRRRKGWGGGRGREEEEWDKFAVAMDLRGNVDDSATLSLLTHYNVTTAIYCKV